LRTEFASGQKVGAMEENLNTKSKSIESKDVIWAVYKDFANQTEKMSVLINSMNDGKKSSKNSSLSDLALNWVDRGGLKPLAGLIVMRNQFLDLKKKLPSIDAEMKKDRRPWLSHIHAIFVALGCLTLGALPFVFMAMYQTKRDKGTVFFTHASETSRIAPAAEKSLKKLGHIKSV
jgi:hypothetical protein